MMRPVVHFVLAAGLVALCGCSVFEPRGQTIILPQPVPQTTGQEKSAPVAPPAQRRANRANQIDRESQAQNKAAPPSQNTEPATIAPHRLVGLSRSQITQLLGKPENVAHNGTSLVWAYRAPNCALRVTFYPNIETKKFHALQYVFEDSKGKTLSDEKACMRVLQTQKHDER